MRPFVAIVLLCVAGCSPTNMNVGGDYRGSAPGLAADLAAMTTLSLKPDATFRMSTGLKGLSGTWKQTEDRLELKFEEGPSGEFPALIVQGRIMSSEHLAFTPPGARDEWNFTR